MAANAFLVIGEYSVVTARLHNVFDFAHQEAADVMVPAPDVVWLDARLTPEQATDRVADLAIVSPGR